MADDSKTLELQIRIAAQEAVKIVSSLKGEIQTLAVEAKKLSDSDGQAIADTFQQIQSTAEKAAVSMKLFGASSSELRQVQSQLKTAAVELVTKGFDPQSEEVKKLIEEYKRLEKEAAGLDEANSKNILSFGNLQSAMMSLAEVAALTKALSVIKDMGAFALQTANNFQTMKNQFGILLGDMEAGAGLFNEIKAFNDVTPFDLDTLTQATNVLIAAKVPLQDLQAQLTKFGDLSQGNSQKMTSYVNAFSQAAAKGKADMQVLNTYLHQGVPILDALAKNFNVTTAEIVKMSSEGQISFSDFSKALDDLTAAGGQYFGGMELASKSLAAMQEGLKEAVNSLAASFGEMLLPAAIAVVGALTDIANAVNESPILKGLLVGALVAITGYLGAMAVKAGIAFAAQMSLNLAIGALNPVVLAATIAVAGLAAGYTIYAASQQKAAKEAEAFAYQQKQQNGAIKDATATLNDYINALKQVDDAKVKMELDFARKEKDAIVQSINDITKALDKANRDGNLSRSGYLKQLLEENARELLNANDSILAIQKLMDDRRTDWIEKMFSGSQEAKIKKINEELAIASGYLSGGNLSESDRTRLQVIVRGLNEELQRLQNRGEDINEKARKWKEDWAEVWGQFQADQSIDPFAGIEMERGKKLEDAWNNYVRSENKETIDQVNAYYDAQRGEIIRQLADEEGRIQRDLSRTKIDNLEYEMQEALRAIDTLETKRIIAAMNSEEEIAAIRERFSQMREDTMLQFTIEINKAKLDEARDAVRNWQEELSDNLLIITMNLKVFSDEAAVIISDLSARFIELSASAALSGFEEFGRALGEGKDAAESLQQAIANMAQQILKQLPMMFLQAGLQLIANGQWALGLGFIAAAGSSAIISGYVDGASKHAQGGVFDEYGKAARAFAAGGTFTNQIVNQPTYFKYGGNLGVMGEAGPEAVMPLRRMPSGNLGVETAGGGANVTVNIINNSNAEVRQEEHTDDEGNKQIDVMIGQLVNNHITLGKADRAMSRFGVRPVGV